MDRHHYKYVVIDSSKHINQSVTADFTVQVPHGLNNCSRVCVKSFTMPNNFHNVYGNIKEVQWVEFWIWVESGLNLGSIWVEFGIWVESGLNFG